MKDEEDLVHRCITFHREGKKKSAINATLVVRFARAAIKRQDPTGNRGRAKLLEEGALKVSTTWAKSWLRANGYSVRAKTTDRTVVDEDVIKAGKQLFDEIAQCRAVRFPGVIPILINLKKKDLENHIQFVLACHTVIDFISFQCPAVSF